MQFGEVKNLNVGGMQMIPIKANGGKPFFLKTGKCFSFGVKKDKKFKTTSVSLKLDDRSMESLKNIIDQCEHAAFGYTVIEKSFLQW